MVFEITNGGGLYLAKKKVFFPWKVRVVLLLDRTNKKSAIGFNLSAQIRIIYWSFVKILIFPVFLPETNQLMVRMPYTYNVMMCIGENFASNL